jgi:hypothetical protein
MEGTKDLKMKREIEVLEMKRKRSARKWEGLLKEEEREFFQTNGQNDSR